MGCCEDLCIVQWPYDHVGLGGSSQATEHCQADCWVAYRIDSREDNSSCIGVSSLGKSRRFCLRCIWCHAFQGLCAEWVLAYWWSTHRWSCWNFLYSWISYQVSQDFQPKGKRWFCILSIGSWAVLFCYLKVAVRIRNLRCFVDALAVHKQQVRRSGSVGPRCLILVLRVRHLLSAKLSMILHLSPM